jgi:predicted RNA binding protein YcfA (HicA-like mRNA interferase family)
MKGIELKLIREFKQQQKTIEDYSMTEMATRISAYADLKGQEKYKLVQKLIDDLDITLDKMDSIESFATNMDEYDDKTNLLREIVIEINDYFTPTSTFFKEILKLEKENLQPEIDKLQELIFTAEYFNYHKTANNFKFQLKKVFDVITYCLNESAQSTVKAYRTAISEIIELAQLKINTKIDLHIKLINELKEEDKEDNKLRKIMSCREMDKLMKDLGYSATRQTGSHLIYKNESGNSIPVPQHSKLNKGLGYTIQKQIRENQISM